RGCRRWWSMPSPPVRRVRVRGGRRHSVRGRARRCRQWQGGCSWRFSGTVGVDPNLPRRHARTVDGVVTEKPAQPCKHVTVPGLWNGCLTHPAVGTRLAPLSIGSTGMAGRDPRRGRVPDGGNSMRNDNKMGEDLKAVAEDVMQLGARCVQAGRAWLNDRRNEMTDRNDENRYGNNRSTYQSQGAGQSRAQGSPRGRQQYQGAQASHQQGGYQQQVYQQPGYQQGEYQRPQGQGGDQSSGHQQYGRTQGSQQYGADDYASQDYGRAQAWGQGGMEREYGQSFEQGLGETSLGQGPYDREAGGYGARAQSDWQRGSQYQYGSPRQDAQQGRQQQY